MPPRAASPRAAPGVRGGVLRAPPSVERVGRGCARSSPVRPRLGVGRFAGARSPVVAARFAVRFAAGVSDFAAGRFDRDVPAVPDLPAAPRSAAVRLGAEARFAVDLFAAGALAAGAARFVLARFGAAVRFVPPAPPAPARDRDRGLGVAGREAEDRPRDCFFPVVRSVSMCVPSALLGLVLDVLVPPERCEQAHRDAGSHRSKRHRACVALLVGAGSS